MKKASASANGPDICLIVPPFDAINFPALGTAVLASACRARGITVRTLYGSVLFASWIGYADYRELCESPIRALLGDRVFRDHAYPPETVARLAEPLPLSNEAAALFERAGARADGLLDTLTEQVLSLRPRIVGLSSTFQQNLAASALARRIKQAAPEIYIVMGGANVSSPMGEGLAETFPWIDHFFAGEADTAFPDFCEAYLRSGVRPSGRVTICEPIGDMSVVHAPVFDDYFDAMRSCHDHGTLPANLPEFVTFESSRGCWWGQKNHCTFCGLNGVGMEFRQKSADRVFEEIQHLTRTWDARRFAAADNIMPLIYLQGLLPRLANWEGHPGLFYEVKANLRPDQLDVMMQGGIDSIQPGIESFSSSTLRLMRKGVSAHQNIALLRYCKGAGIHVAWNYLYGLPGEDAAEYEAVLELLPKLEHLEPPSGCSPIIVDRYSPYHNTPETFGITNVRPYPSYEALYPPEAPLESIAYHFKGTYSTTLLERPDLVERLATAIARWRKCWKNVSQPPALRVLSRPNGAIVVDTRRIASAPMTLLSASHDKLLRHLEKPRRPDQCPDGPDLEFLRERNFVVEHEGLLMSIVTRPRDVDEALALTDGAFRASTTALKATHAEASP